MIPCLPRGGGEEDLDKDPCDQEEDFGSGEESLDDIGIPPPYSPPPGPSLVAQLHRDQISAPNAIGQQLLGDQTPVLTQNLKVGSQPAPWEPGYERGHDIQSPAPPEVEGNRESSQSDKGYPALCSEDFFFSDPLLPSITRIPLGLSQPPQQILRRSRQLLGPPPIMSVWTQPTPAPILTWQCGPEITAVTSLLEMSRGETSLPPPQSPP